MPKKHGVDEQSTSLLQSNSKDSTSRPPAASSKTNTTRSKNDEINDDDEASYELTEYAHGHQQIKGTSDDDDEDSDGNDDHHHISDDRPPDYEEEESREPLKYKRRKRRLQIFAVVLIIFLIFSALYRVALARLFTSFLDSINTADIDENEGDADVVNVGNSTSSDNSTIDGNTDTTTLVEEQHTKPKSPYTQLLSLSEDLVPTKHGKYKDRRLVFIGDVHGCVEERT